MAKRFANRALRAAARGGLRRLSDAEAVVLPLLREVSDVWSMPKDGKARFDPQRWPRFMRK